MQQIKALYKKIPIQVLLWLKWLLFIICLIILVLTITEINTRLIVNQNKPTQFYATWYGFRTFLAEGENPYSAAMQNQIANSDSPFADGLLDKDTYIRQPLYGIILYLPFLFIRDFSQAYGWWLTTLELAAVFLAILSVSLIKKNLKKNAFYIGLAILIVVGSLSFQTAMLTGSVAIFSFLILFSCLKAIQNGGDELTGVLLSILTVFPFYGWISMLFILIWTLRQKRSRVLWWFIGTIILFGFAIALLEPQWLLYYLQMWVRYFKVVEIHFVYQLLDSVLPATFLLPGFITLFLAGLLVIEWGLAGRVEFILFYWTFQLTLVVESVLTLDIDLVNLLFLPSVLTFILAIWVDRWKDKGRLVGILISLLCILIPRGLDSLMGERGPVQILLVISIIGAILILNLYWVRWWLTRNVLLWHRDVYSLEESGKGSEFL